jgi:hypothetical protein
MSANDTASGEPNTANNLQDAPDSADTGSVDPEDFVRAMLHISPEDAAKVRERTPGTRQTKSGQVGPVEDHGKDEAPAE